MKRLLFIVPILFIALVSCTKNETTLQNSPYDGQWRWIGTSIGPFSTFPPIDSPVVLTMSPGNFYKVTLNGALSIQGTFAADSNAYWTTLKFNNITQPFGDTTSETSGNITEVYFNYSNIGRLVIFQNNRASIAGDTLTLVRYPITPETPVSSFIRMVGKP
jgi:hypothetical protein